MSIIKISFLLRSLSASWEYKKSTDNELWSDLAAKLEAKLSPVKPLQQPKGSVQCHFYIAADSSTDQCKKMVMELLAAMIPDEDTRKKIIVSVTEPDDEELLELNQTVADKETNPQFWGAVQNRLPAEGSEPKKKNEQPKENPLSKAAEKATNAMAPKTQPEPEDPQPPEDQEAEPPALSEQAEKIKALKEGLLGKVHGQRHAVDEVVQSIFECEMFAALNPDRKGPLATFLFTGPSGVGKTFLAELSAKLLDRPVLVVDMSEYSSNLANVKFNGEHGESAVVTGFVRKHPNGIIIFDEVEKAHINTIHLFLQILDAARLMDHQIKKEVSFRDTIIIMTTNAGKALYDDSTVCDLSATPRSVILDALRTEVNPQTREPFFPECITTRMANGHVILFNHLEPFSLMEIVKDEIALQLKLFEKSSGIKVQYDPRLLASLVMYNGGGMADARTLRGLARSILVRELQEIVMQLFSKGTAQVDALKNITITVDTECDDEDTRRLFVQQDKMRVAVFTDKLVNEFTDRANQEKAIFDVLSDEDSFKKRVRGVTDYVLLDPLCGLAAMEREPNDIADLDSAGMRMFDYLRDFAPEIPIYILDTATNLRSFDTLLANGARGVIRLKNADPTLFDKTLDTLSFSALINNAVYSLGRSGKFLHFSCAEYLIDETCAVLSFEKLLLKSAPRAGDSNMIARKGDNNNLKFSDVVGCRAAKETLKDYKEALDDPRKTALSGKKMPKGVLLYGPPGTGKTLLAKAMANECNATFFPVSATSFFGSLVGQTEKNIRDLFAKARKYAPSIIFIDEVDAIGRVRSGSVGSTHNEDALTTFLAEMDGFVTDEKRPVFIMAATNYAIAGDGGRVLDPAFVRRFDSKILIPLPDTDDRYELLKLSLKRHGIHFGESHEQTLRNMATRTAGMNNADLEMMNAQYARGLGDAEPDPAKYLDALDNFRYGEINKMRSKELRQTACHEAGHALICRLCGTTPSFLTVVSRGNFGGYMESAGEDTSSFTFQQLLDRVCRCLAGRAAEILCYGEEAGNNTGASSDIRMARYYLKASVNDYAMGDKLYAEWKPEEIEKLMQEQYARTQAMLQEHRDTLERLTDLLTAKKSLDQAQMEAFFQAENI